MNIVLWILQILVGAMFLFHSYTLGLRHEQARARKGMEWVGDLPDGLRIFVAVSEALGGIGLILPAALGIFAWLTPLAGALLALAMLLAIGFHLLRREYRNIVINLVLGVLAAVVAYGRFVIAPF